MYVYHALRIYSLLLRPSSTWKICEALVSLDRCFSSARTRFSHILRLKSPPPLPLKQREPRYADDVVDQPHSAEFYTKFPSTHFGHQAVWDGDDDASSPSPLYHFASYTHSGCTFSLRLPCFTVHIYLSTHFAWSSNI